MKEVRKYSDGDLAKPGVIGHPSRVKATASAESIITHIRRLLRRPRGRPSRPE